jgi:hypothetical protein
MHATFQILSWSVYLDVSRVMKAWSAEVTVLLGTKRCGINPGSQDARMVSALRW